MELQILILVSFVGLTVIAAAVGLLVRDLAVGGNRGAGVKQPALGRLPLARDERPPTSPVGSLDEYLSRLVLESGLEWSPVTAVLSIVACGLIAGGGLYLWYEDDLVAAIGALAGMVVPLGYLIYRRGARIKQILTQIPDALDLLSRAVRAGQSLDQAISLVGEKTSEPLATEFRRCAKQLHMGLSLSAAMRALVHRLRLVEVRIFATTLAVHRQTGGNLALTLERMAAVMRERMMYRRQMQAAMAAGRYSATIIASIGPLLFAYMFMFQREYAIRLINLPLGQSLLVLAAALEIVGLVWVLRLLRKEY